MDHAHRGNPRDGGRKRRAPLIQLVPHVPAPASSPALDEDFHVLFRDHFRYVWKSLRRLGIAVADCEDLTQEVFVAVHRHRHERDTTRPPRPWLFGFAFRIALGHKRKKSVSSEVPTSDSILDRERDSDRDIGKIMNARDAHRVVQTGLAALSDEQRAVFVLHELDEESAPDIADALGIPLNTVYSRLRLARERFRAVVSGNSEGGSS